MAPPGPSVLLLVFIQSDHLMFVRKFKFYCPLLTSVIMASPIQLWENEMDSFLAVTHRHVSSAFENNGVTKM